MKIAYLTNCFGSQSHTFIRREIRALRRRGVPLALFGIRADHESVADDAKDLVQETQYLYPLAAAEAIKDNAHYFVRSPIRYVRGATRALLSPELSIRRRAKMVYHFFTSAPIARKLQAAEISHVHAHFMNVSASIAMYASWHSGIPYSITVHSAGTFGTDHIVGIAQKLTDAQFLMMISHYNIEYFDEIAPCRDKSHVVRCGMDLSQFPLRESAPNAGGRAKKLLGVGRFVEKKGFEYLIRAVGLLSERGTSVHLTLIGDGPLMGELQELVGQSGLEKQVTLTGRLGTEKVRAAMSEADVVIIPSVTSQSGEKEGLPVVIMEAMASGVPVVATEHSGIPEIVLAGKTGQLVPERDAAALAEAIEASLAQTDKTQIGQARALIEEEFNIEAVADKRLALFREYDER